MGHFSKNANISQKFQRLTTSSRHNSAIMFHPFRQVASPGGKGCRLRLHRLFTRNALSPSVTWRVDELTVQETWMWSQNDADVESQHRRQMKSVGKVGGRPTVTRCIRSNNSLRRDSVECLTGQDMSAECCGMSAFHATRWPSRGTAWRSIRTSACYAVVGVSRPLVPTSCILENVAVRRHVGHNAAATVLTSARSTALLRE